MPKKKWTLEQCVSYALKHNLSMQQSVLDTHLAELQKKNAIGAFVPDINASANHDWNTGANIDVTTNTFVTTTIQNTSVGLRSNITIFDGLKNLHNLYKANLNILSKQYQLDDMRDNISLQVANAFLQILFNKESLKTLKSQYEINKIEQKRVQQLVTNGIKPEGDLLQIAATIATQEQKIVEGENKVQISRLALANLLQLQDVLNFDIVNQAYDIPFSQVLQKTPQDIFSKALTIRNDILVAQTNVDLAKYDISVARGNFSPTLTGFFNYGTRASQEESFKDLWRQFELYDGFSFGLSLTIPIFNKFQNITNLQRNKILFEKSKLNLKQKKNRVKRQSISGLCRC